MTHKSSLHPQLSAEARDHADELDREEAKKMAADDALLAREDWEAQRKTEAPMESEPTTPEGGSMKSTAKELQIKARQADARRAAVAVYAPDSPTLPRLEREAREAAELARQAMNDEAARYSEEQFSHRMDEI